eukprot:8142427-Pyramimonas_sp.AAC.1
MMRTRARKKEATSAAYGRLAAYAASEGEQQHGRENQGRHLVAFTRRACGRSCRIRVRFIHI